MTDFIEPYLVRRRDALFEYGSYEQFEDHELSKANKKIAKVNIKIALGKINGELGEIEYEIGEAVKENNYSQKIDHESKMIYVFAAIFFEAHLEDYLNLDSGDIPFEGDFDIKILKDFDKVIELLARYKWYIWLLNTTKGKMPQQIVSGYTVKGIIMAYYYMHRKAIYPIKELEGIWVLKDIFKRLHEIYGPSINSFKNDWNPIISDFDYRLQHPNTIKESIEILKTFSYPNIQDAINLANDELKEAELRKN
jgi:hypothetical protein